MGQVVVTFRGTCTNFRGVIPGVPHRVVLPNGNATRFGSVTFADMRQTIVPWSLAPHTASVVIDDGSPDKRINWGRTIQCGKISRPVHLEIVNGTNKICYDKGKAPYDRIPSLCEYVHQFQYSADVVLRGRALCYFDLRNGTIASHTGRGGGLQVQATIATDGAPCLRTTDLTSGESTVMQLPDTATMTVSNVGIDCDKSSVGADFMLHFLTAAGGIPLDLLKMPPGWREHDTLLCVEKTPIHPDLLDPCEVVTKTLGIPEIHLSCSNSRYP
jgi:hypothetical protein